MNHESSKHLLQSIGYRGRPELCIQLFFFSLQQATEMKHISLSRSKCMKQLSCCTPNTFFAWTMVVCKRCCLNTGRSAQCALRMLLANDTTTFLYYIIASLQPLFEQKNVSGVQRESYLIHFICINETMLADFSFQLLGCDGFV